jgi:hypothetical protein
MFAVDERIRGLPATRDKVAGLYQSINTLHLAIPRKRAGPAQAFIVGARVSSGLRVCVYLFLSETADCAVYLADRPCATPEDYQQQSSEALSFVESMGFIMDNLNFRNLPPAQQDELLRTLPVFQKEPPALASTQAAGAPKKEAPKSPAVLLGRIFSAF